MGMMLLLGRLGRLMVIGLWLLIGMDLLNCLLGMKKMGKCLCLISYRYMGKMFAICSMLSKLNYWEVFKNN